MAAETAYDEHALFSYQVNQALAMSLATARYPYIVSTSLFSGEPHIEGLRIRVRDIALARDKGGFTPEEIVATIYPDLTLAQVYSALAYFEDHRDEIEQAANDEQDAIEHFRRIETYLLVDRCM